MSSEQLGKDVTHCLEAVVSAQQRGLCHRVAQHAGRDRMALVVVAVEQALRRDPVDHLGQFPAQVHRILNTDAEALPAHRGMHVGSITGQQNPSVAIDRGLASDIGEPRDPGGLWIPKSDP